MTRTIVVQYHFKDRLAAWWTENNPVLGPAEPGVEIDTGRFKLGDGHTHWNDLLYFTPAASDSGLDAHVQSEEPHAVYDDGPSLLGLYQNAKV